MKCIILAAGKGSRMGKLTEETPKPLLEIKNNKTILDFIFESLPEKIGEVIIVVNHLSEIFEEEIKKKYKDFNKKIVFVKKNKKNGTLGSVYAAKKFLKKEKSFLVLQGDDIHQKKYLEKIIKQTWVAGIGKIKMPKEYFYIECDKESYFKNSRRQKKEELENGSWIFSGVYVLNNDIFKIEKKRVCKNSKEFGIPQTLINHHKIKKLKILRERSFLTANSEKELRFMRKELKNKK